MGKWGSREPRSDDFWVKVMVILFVIGGLCTAGGRLVGLIWGTH